MCYIFAVLLWGLPWWFFEKPQLSVRAGSSGSAARKTVRALPPGRRSGAQALGGPQSPGGRWGTREWQLMGAWGLGSGVGLGTLSAGLPLEGLTVCQTHAWP